MANQWLNKRLVTVVWNPPDMPILILLEMGKLSPEFLLNLAANAPRPGQTVGPDG